MSLRGAVLALFICLTPPGPVMAEADAWTAGAAAFSAGDYDTALLHFADARDAGLQGPAVHYNIAVSQFKLERYEQAAATFQHIAAEFPQMAGLAHYNLGLVARRQGYRELAIHHFLRAYNLSHDEKIQILASQRLRELEPEIRTASRWSGAFGLRAGNDDNIALRDEAGVPVGTTTESPMADLFASFIGPRTGSDGFRLRGSAYLIRYSDADEFDQAEVRLGGFYEWRRRDWRAELGIHSAASTLGGDAFDRKLGANARIARYIGENHVLDLRYSYDDVSEGDEIFTGIGGSRQRVDARYKWYREDHRVQLRYIVEDNDRESAAVSPERSAVIMDYRYLPLRGFGYEAGVELRDSEYADIAIPREEDLVTVFGTLSYAFSNDWSVLFEYRHSDNESTDPTFTYDRRKFTLGAMKVF